MPESWQFPLVAAIVAIVLGAFFGGMRWNVRKGDKFLKWLRGGLPVVGERATMRWLGSSVLELKIANAKDPFRSAETLVLFEPRDFLPLWALGHLRGRRDTFIFRSQLRSAPTFEMEAYDARGWTRRDVPQSQEGKSWSKLDMGGGDLVAYGSDRAQANAKALVDAAARAGGKVLRFAVRRSVPNLEVHWILPDDKSSTALDFFTALKKVAQDVLKA